MKTEFSSLFFAFSVALALISCGPPPPVLNPVPPDKDVVPQTSPCGSYIRYHYVFAVFADGLEIGREVRSTIDEEGPLGPERLTVSHVTRRLKSGAYDYDIHTIRAERTLERDGTLLRASYVSQEQLSSTVTMVGFNGSGWDRIAEDRVSVTDPISTTPSSVQLTGREILGLRMTDHMRDIASGKADYSDPVYYYDPSIDAPIIFNFEPPVPGTLEHGGAKVDGVWVSALKEGSLRIKIFFSADGVPIEEHYPSLHQIRRLSSEPVDLPPDASAPPTGLMSTAYLGVPTSATHARFELVTAQHQEKDALDFLGEADNQKLKKIEPGRLELSVEAGAPDGREPPTREDLSTTQYIKPKDQKIVDALRFLRSGGTRGNLPKIRKENATPVIARVKLIRNPSTFWQDKDKVAELVLSYVYSMLPDKRHTFSMADAVETLTRGGGDCTEHSVLFASLMRAQGIESRLVAGLFLARGGRWVYHMWAEYWDGFRWQPVDPGNGIFRPGALYVALGRGAPKFSDLRQDVASFLDRSFSGVSFDLVEAGNNGEKLRLARPRLHGQSGSDSGIYNAVAFSGRGDPAGALDSLLATAQPDTSPVGVALFMAGLQVDAGLYGDALATIAVTRTRTSSPGNTYLLDTLEARALMASGDPDGAGKILEGLSDTLDEKDPAFVQLQAELLYFRGKEEAAIAMLGCGLETHPEDPDLLTSYSDHVSRRALMRSEQNRVAIGRALQALTLTLYTQSEVFTAMARLYLNEGKLAEASAAVDHGLVLAPLDDELLQLRTDVSSAVDRCREE